MVLEPSAERVPPLILRAITRGHTLRSAALFSEGTFARPGLVAGGAIEINTVPRFVSQDVGGVTYNRIPRLQFPADKEGRTILLHQLTHYSKKALFDRVERWLAGGEAAART